MTSLYFNIHRLILKAVFLIQLQQSFSQISLNVLGNSLIEDEQIVVTGVNQRSTFLAPLQESTFVRKGARARSTEINQVSGLSTNGKRIFAAGRNDEENQLLTLRLEKKSHSIALTSSIVLKDVDQNETMKPMGLLSYKNEFFVLHDDTKISKYDDQGVRQSILEAKEYLFQRKGDGLKSISMDPVGEVLWVAPFVGQPRDGIQNVRLVQYMVESFKTDDLPQFVYVLESDPTEQIDRTVMDSGPIDSQHAQNPNERKLEQAIEAHQSYRFSDEPQQSPPYPEGNDKLADWPRRLSNATSSPSDWNPDNSSDPIIPRSGLVSLIALDKFGNFLALERVRSAKNSGVGIDAFHLQLFYVESASAMDVTGIDLVGDTDLSNKAVKKTILLDFADLDYGKISMPNFDCMTLLPSNSNEPLTLLFASNNEYKQDEATYLMALDLNFHREVPPPEPPRDDTNSFQDTIVGDSQIPSKSAKTWLHPHNPAESVVISTDGERFTIFDLNGTALVENRGSGVGDSSSSKPRKSSFRDLDIIYSFPIAEDRLVDLIVFADAANSALDFRLINPFTVHKRGIGDVVTGWSKNDTLGKVFAADFVTAYLSPYTGTFYVFVGGNDARKIVQRKIFATSWGLVDSTIVRRIQLPEESQLVAMEVDLVTGYLYVAINSTNETSGIYKVDAEPAEPVDDSIIFLSKVAIPSTTNKDIIPVFTDLSIYYAGDEGGYLLASHPSDASIAIFNRNGDNDFLDTVQIVGSHSESNTTLISSEISVINSNVGPGFSCGVVVVQAAKISNNSQSNSNSILSDDSETGFQLLQWAELRTQTSSGEVLQVDTQSWHPRRLALVILIDKIAQDIFVAMTQGTLTAKQAQGLLELLAEAAYQVYQPGSAMRKMMSYAAGIRAGNSDNASSTDIGSAQPVVNVNMTTPTLRGIQPKKNNNIFLANTVLPSCPLDTLDDKQGEYAQAATYLKDFVWRVGDVIADKTPNPTSDFLHLKEVGKLWIRRTEAIIWALPHDIQTM